jgi:hypothetical protein
MARRLRAAALAGGLALVLAGCSGSGMTAFGRAAPTEMAVARGAVIVVGPEGYCVDRRASRGGEPAFVLLASCAAITGDPAAPRPLVAGLLTASVTQARVEGATPDIMRSFFVSPAGRAALARDGKPSSVRVLDSFVEGDAVMMFIEDTGAGAPPGTVPLYWRGVFALNGQLVTLSVLSFASRPMSRDAGLATLRAFISRVERHSPPPRAAEETEAKGRRGPAPLSSLLSRLLR